MSPAVYQWAARHGVSLQALNELQAIFGMHGGHDLPPTLNAKEASELAERVGAELAKFGIDGTVNAASYFALNQ